MPITLKKDVWKVKDPSSGQYRGAAILSTTLPQDAAQIISESNTTIQNIKDMAIEAVDTALNDESTGLIPKAEADRDAIDDSLNNASNGIIPTAQSDRDDIDDSLNNINDGIIPEAQANLATIAAAVQSQISQGTDKTLSVAKGFADAKAAGMMVKVSNYQPGSALDDPATSQDASQNTGYPVYKDSNRIWVKETYAELEVPTMDDHNELKSAIDNVVFRASDNYIFATSFPNNGKINTDGSITTSSSNKISDYYKVDEGDVVSGMLTAGNNIIAIACYDNSKLFRSEVSVIKQFSGTFTIPNGISYVRFCYWTAYPANHIVFHSRIYDEGIKKNVNHNMIEISKIQSDLYFRKSINSSIEQSEEKPGYKVSNNTIESAASNICVHAYKVNIGIVEFTAEHPSNTETEWTYALFKADAIDECNQSTIIDTVRYFNKRIANTVIIDQECLLCITSRLEANRMTIKQNTIIKPISEYAQEQIGDLIELETDNKQNIVSSINEVISNMYPRWHIEGVVTDQNWYRVDAIEGSWLLIRNSEHVALYKNDGTLVKNLNSVWMRGTHKPELYCDGTWDYAIVYATSGKPPMIVQDASLFLGDSYIGLGSSNIAEEFGLQFYSSHWAHGHGGYTAKQIADMVTGVPGLVEDYDPDYINAWSDGKFARAFLYCGANLINEGHIETLEENTVDDNIPKNVVGSIADLFEGNSITVNGITINTVNDYYSLFGNTTLGQYAFLIEYMQAKCNNPIYLMGYVPWATLIGRENLITTVCNRLELLYGVKFLNTFSTTGYSIRNSTEILYDGIHLSLEATPLYVERMLKEYISQLR